MQNIDHMKPVLIEHEEIKLIGIPCISLKDMKSKYENAKESLFAISQYMPQVVNERIHYGIWPITELQDNPETHAYILCVEVKSYDGIPEWFTKITLPKQSCVVVANNDHDFNAAGEALYSFVEKNNLELSSNGREYRICEKYDYDVDGYVRYSLPIVS
ncbi:GyrI-like domain-containing protein [Cytobacillus sp. Hm23]